jgi:lysyl-tRNA synthetase class 1
MGHSLSHVPDPRLPRLLRRALPRPFEEALQRDGMEIEVLRSHELYEAGVYAEVTREALDHTEELREILQERQRREMPVTWSPFLPRAASGRLAAARISSTCPMSTRSST